MGRNIVLGGEGLPDIRQVAHDCADAACLTNLQLRRDELEGRGLCHLPLNLVAEGDSEFPGDADPISIAEDAVGLTILYRAINRGRDAKESCVFRIARIVGAVRLYRGEDFVFDFCCNHILTVL